MSVTAERTPLLAVGYRGATVGAFSLVFLAAFEALAVTTVMPTVSADLDGRQWYAVAFSATLAAGLIGMVATGTWSDRRGAVRPLLAAVSTFAVGLLVAGLAPSMGVLVLGRFVQGLGAGGISVALYVLVAQVYAAVDRPRILGLFAAAWVLPGIVGPFAAGVVAETLGWRWVFLGVVVLSAAALLVLVPTLRGAGARGADVRTAGHAVGGRRLVLASAAAAGVLLLNLAGDLPLTGGLALAVAGLAATLLPLRPLLPGGTLLARPGVPAVVALRGLIGAAFLATEAYLPYLLQAQYDLRVWVSGLVLTAASITWASASQVQGRLDRWSDRGALRTGSWILLAGIGAVAVTAATGLPALAAGLGWAVAAAGMGLMYPRITSHALAASEPSERGSISASVTLADSVGAAAATALAGLVFTAVGTSEDRGAFVAVLVLACVLGAVAVLAARRV